MAADGPPGTDALPSDLGSAIAALNTWSNPELQSKLAELGAPTMGKKVFRMAPSAMEVALYLAKKASRLASCLASKRNVFLLVCENQIIHIVAVA